MVDFDIVDDGYEAYYTEKLWAMIPEVYRHEDGLTVSPGVLRGLIETWAKQAANLRRSQDRLWADMFIEMCSDWAIPYIGDLVGTRLISAQNRRGQRVDVAKTIYYRRRAGTVRVLEELIADMTGWEGVVVEGWKTLARTFHYLDLPPQARGRLTQTLPGGTAEIRTPTSHLVRTPFEEFYRTVDVRPNKPYGIRKIGFYVYRVSAVKLSGVQPKPHTAPTGNGYTIDPSGRDIPLFARRSRPELWDEWRSAKEYEVPAPISCRLLANASYEIRAELPQTLIDELSITAGAANDLQALVGKRYISEARLRTALAMRPSSVELLSEAVYQGILAHSALPDCGKQALLPASITIEVDDTVMPNEVLASANLSVWEASSFNKYGLIDSERGRLLLDSSISTSVLVDYHVGMYMPLGAGGFSRPFEYVASDTRSGGGALNALPVSGTVIIADSMNYSPITNINGITDLTITSANQARPYLMLMSGWILTAAPAIPPALDATVTLDGLWLGAEGTARSVFIDGDFETVTLRYCTFDPGGEDSDGNEIPPVRLVIRGFVEHLIIDHCVMAPIRMTTGAVETVTIRDSVVQSTRAGVNALDIGIGTVDISRSSILGDVDVLRLYATDTLVAGRVDVTDTQDGCFRFSAATEGSRLPHPYETVSLDSSEIPSLFSSEAYGQPDYAMLHLNVPDTIARGGENGGEMGVYYTVGAPYKHDGLRVKVAEYIPFGLAPVYTIMT